MRIETIGIATIDGVHLAADVGLVPEPRGGVVLAHPHPLHGGDRHHPLIDSLFRALPEAGMATIRFDFRGGGDSEGTHDEGRSERTDVVAALDAIEPYSGDGPLWLVGYSFGAIVCLDVTDPRIHGWVAVAPPLWPLGTPPLASRDHRPTTLLVPEHDQFAPYPDVVGATTHWTNVSVEPVAMADHFLFGQVSQVTGRAITPLTSG